MKLEYKILWIEDQPREMDYVKNHLGIRLARKGLKLDVQWMEGVRSLKDLKNEIRKRMDIDLVLVDYNLGEGQPSGDKVANAVRAAARGMEIVFYSSEDPKALLSMIAERGVDGAYCANRRDLLDPTWNVIQASIKKVLDLNGLRGIVMSSLADFDSVIDSSIAKIEGDLGKELQQKLRERILDMVCSFHAKNLDKIAKMDLEHGIEKYSDMLSSTPKHVVLKELLEEMDDVEIGPCLEKLATYEDQVIRPRNDLAHGKGELKGNAYIVANKGREGKKFTESDFARILADLWEHEENLLRLEAFLQQRPKKKES